MVYKLDKFINKPFKQIIYSLAFTLAEVLIVMGIIGVIAEIIIPELISNVQKDTTVTILKEDYSMINQVLYRAASDSGGDLAQLFLYDSTPIGSSYQTIVTNFVTTNVIPYVKITKDCGYSTTLSCIGDYVHGLNNALEPGAAMSKYIIFLNNGSSLSFIPDNYLGFWTGMIIIVDINGSKKPNTFGKDVFEMRYYGSENKIMFFGNDETRNNMLNDGSNGCNTSSIGMYCGALIMYDGWKISDDYPW